MDTEYDWEKGTSIINVTKTLLSSNPKNNVTKCMITWDDWTKKYLHVCLIHRVSTDKRFFTWALPKFWATHDQQPGHFLNLLHPNISMHILHTVLYTFLMVLTRRIYLKIKSFFGWWSFSLVSWPQCVIQWWYCKENFDVSHP